jgi:hypothetical protein
LRHSDARVSQVPAAPIEAAVYENSYRCGRRGHDRADLRAEHG